MKGAQRLRSRKMKVIEASQQEKGKKNEEIEEKMDRNDVEIMEEEDYDGGWIGDEKDEENEQEQEDKDKKEGNKEPLKVGLPKRASRRVLKIPELEF